MPAYTTLAFNTNVSHRQDVCDRQEAFHNRTVELRNALQGFELHPWFPFGLFSTLDPVTGAIVQERPGFTIEILDEIAKRAKFQWRNSFGVTNMVEELGNRTLDDLLQWTVQTYDVTVAPWSKSLERINSGVSFPEGIYDSSIIMIGLEETGSSLHVWSFLEPFDWTVWVMILVTFLVAGLVYWWMEWYNEDSDRQELQNKPTETVFFAALSFTGESSFEPSTDYARLFVLGLAFWSLLMASAYTANLASFLVVENTPSLQIESVADAVRLKLPMCVLGGSVMEATVSRIHPGAILVRMDPSKGEANLYLGVVRGECTLAISALSSWDEYRRDSSVNEDCQLVWIGRVFRFVQAGLATFSDSGTLCTSLIRDVLNLHVLEMEEDGFVQTAWERHLEAEADINCEATTRETESGGLGDSNQRLSLKDMGGLFIVFYGLTAITICMAIFSMWNSKHKLNRRNSSSGRGNNTTLVEEHEGHNGNIPSSDTGYTYSEQQGNGGDGGSANKEIALIRRQMSDMQQQMNQQMSDMLIMLNNVQPIGLEELPSSINGQSIHHRHPQSPQSIEETEA